MILAAVYFLLVGFHVPYVIQLALFFWNTWHVARQNNGILAIYRSRACISDPVQKTSANHAILAVSLFLAVWNIRTHQQIGPLFAMITPAFVLYVSRCDGRGCRCISSSASRSPWRGAKSRLAFRKGCSSSPARSSFTLICWCVILQYATLIMLLLPHYVQYLALVWLLHRRKFVGPSAAAVPAPLRALSTRRVVLLPVLALVGSGWAMLQNVSMKARPHWICLPLSVPLGRAGALLS